MGGDGVVRDDSWIEVFESQFGTIAIVQAAGPDYPRALAAALAYPRTEDDEGETLAVPSGKLALFSAAVDGEGPDSVPLLPARPGSVPLVHGWPSGGVDPGLLIQSPHRSYELKVRWYTQVGEDDCFARWLLIPSATGLSGRT